MLKIKSIRPVRVPGAGWDVRARLTDGREHLLAGTGPYTMAQAQRAADSLRRDVARHGLPQHWLHQIGECA